MKQDRFLIGILIVIGFLVILSIGLFVSRQSSQDYGLEDTPQGVIHNYVIALGRQDYTRAYGYLKETNKPGFETFRQAFLSHQVNPAGAAVQIGQVRLGDQKAWVDLYLLTGGNNLMSEPYRESSQAYLEQDSAGVWKIASMPYQHWGWDWYTPIPAPMNAPTKP
jgi:hypothetical protein